MMFGSLFETDPIEEATVVVGGSRCQGLNLIYRDAELLVACEA